jgi:hypothetical protein
MVMKMVKRVAGGHLWRTLSEAPRVNTEEQVVPEYYAHKATQEPVAACSGVVENGRVIG